MCLGCVFYVFREWRDSPNLVSAVNVNEIDRHNKVSGVSFTRGSNSMFAGRSLEDVKNLFQSYLSDDFKELYFCPSKEDKTAIVPEAYNFREIHKECAAPVMYQGACSSAYALTLASMVSDRLCLSTGKRNPISPQHVISCDVDINEGCKKGYVQRAYDFHSRNGFYNETCMPYALGAFVNCSQKCNTTMEEGRRASKICGIDLQEQIKREIVLNGPVVAALEVHSDFLTYKSGIYSADFAKYVYAGGHVVKVIGWGEELGRKYWIIENTWGEDWGEKGTGRIEIQGKDDLHISQIALAVVVEGKKEEKKPKGGETAEKNQTTTT